MHHRKSSPPNDNATQKRTPIMSMYLIDPLCEFILLQTALIAAETSMVEMLRRLHEEVRGADE
jgi:hypothetical protein